MYRIVTTMLTSVLVSLAAGTIRAHHSVAMFDTTTAVTIRGALSRIEFANPHSFLYLMQETPEGAIEWAVEGPAPNQLVRMGVERGMFAEGDVIEACGYVLKDDAEVRYAQGRVLVAEVLVMPDGRARLWSPYGNEHCRDRQVYTIGD